MKSAPLPFHETARLKALHDYHLLDTLPEDVYDDITRLATEICRTPISAISLIDSDRQWFKSRQRLKPDETPRDLAFCGYTILDPKKMFIVPDAREDERFADNPLTTGYPKVIFYAGIPLSTPDGHVLGSLCVIDNRPRQLTDNQLLSLKALAKLVMAHFELRKTQLHIRQACELLNPVEQTATALRNSRFHLDQQPALIQLQQTVTRLKTVLQNALPAEIPV